MFDPPKFTSRAFGPDGHFKIPHGRVQNPPPGRQQDNSLPTIRSEIQAYSFSSGEGFCLSVRSGRREASFVAIPVPLNFEQMASVQETVLNGRRSGVVAEEFSQSSSGRLDVIGCFFDLYRFVIISSRPYCPQPASVRSCAGTSRQDQQVFTFSEKSLSPFSSAFELIGFEEVFEKGMGFAINDAIAGLNGRHAPLSLQYGFSRFR